MDKNKVGPRTPVQNALQLLESDNLSYEDTQSAIIDIAADDRSPSLAEQLVENFLGGTVDLRAARERVEANRRALKEREKKK